jgi:hypothetical protein
MCFFLILRPADRGYCHVETQGISCMRPRASGSISRAEQSAAGHALAVDTFEAPPACGQFNGNRCGDGAGIWELDRVSLRTMASGSGRPVRGPHPRDITSQTRTPATPGADGTEVGPRCEAIRRLNCAPVRLLYEIFGIGLVSSEVVRQVVERIGVRESVAAKGRAVPISGELDSVPS